MSVLLPLYIKGKRNKATTQLAKFDFKNHGSFEEEWLPHKKCQEWWYATGVLQDDKKQLYSFQYTLLRLSMGLLTLKVAMVALTDFEGKKHFYRQQKTLRRSPICLNLNEASFKNVALAKKEKTGIAIFLRHRDFSLQVMAEYGKGPIWHGEKGILQMGINGTKEVTHYYSYPNMPTKGTLFYEGKKIPITGKTWFDRQGGPYSILDTRTMWEWFSLRFDDNEEMMLFTFPQDSYQDGTYIDKEGHASRLLDYHIQRTGVLIKGGLRWSKAWDLNVRGGSYQIVPLQTGHINLLYFEELCGIYDKTGLRVGYCFAELLPGVLNTSFPKGITLLKNIEKCD